MDIIGAARTGTGGGGHDDAVTADGQRFLINVITGEAAATPITLLVNWMGVVT